jgi:hypothetical protein
MKPTNAAVERSGANMGRRLIWRPTLRRKHKRTAVHCLAFAPWRALSALSDVCGGVLRVLPRRESVKKIMRTARRRHGVKQTALHNGRNMCLFSRCCGVCTGVEVSVRYCSKPGGNRNKHQLRCIQHATGTSQRSDRASGRVKRWLGEQRGLPNGPRG